MSGCAHIIRMLFRRLWLFGWLAMVIICIIALQDVSYTTCQSHIPILLSRALTTDPHRGIMLCFCLVALASVTLFKRIGMFIGFASFFSAFLVSMFETNAHEAFIMLGSACILYECWPEPSCLWKLHWWTTLCTGATCFGFLIWTELGCVDGDVFYCQECSWWYITEYIFFWSLFLLVYWRIPNNLQIHDNLSPPTYTPLNFDLNSNPTSST